MVLPFSSVDIRGEVRSQEQKKKNSSDQTKSIYFSGVMCPGSMRPNPVGIKQLDTTFLLSEIPNGSKQLPRRGQKTAPIPEPRVLIVRPVNKHINTRGR